MNSPSSIRTWRLRGRELELGEQTQLMGILNCTPDSFSDGGKFTGEDKTLPKPELVLAQAQQMLAQGATILDIGGESTRPGATPVSEAEELARVIPVIKLLVAELPQALLSLDTRKAAVAKAGLRAGAHAINDISLLQDPAMAATAAREQAGLILSHLRGEPATMQAQVHFTDPLAEVAEELATAAEAALAAGLSEEQLVLDPGIGFGKNRPENLALLQKPDALRWRNRPLLIGLSRKRLLGELCDLPNAQERDPATAISSALLAQAGVDLLRVHNIALNQQALRLQQALASSENLPRISP